MVMEVADLKDEITAIESADGSDMSKEADTLTEMVGETPLQTEASSDPKRGVERNKSGGAGRVMGRRAPPKRSQSHKIGRPVFHKELPPEPSRGVNRNQSGRLRSAPGRARSFGKSVPDRSGSTGSLKAYRKKQHSNQLVQHAEEGDAASVTDSVFTSASNQTLDSIMLRKKQFTSGDGKGGDQGLRMPHRTSDVGSTASFDFDDESLHTVDSINLHHRHVTEVYDDDNDLSVFSESFCSENTYDLSDYEEEEGADVREVDLEEEIEEGSLKE